MKRSTRIGETCTACHVHWERPARFEARARGGAPRRCLLARGVPAAACWPVLARVRKFDRRPIELFELFTAEFGQSFCQDSGKILTFLQKILEFWDFSTFSRMFGEISRIDNQIRCKNSMKIVEKDCLFAEIRTKTWKSSTNFANILNWERCEGVYW